MSSPVDQIKAPINKHMDEFEIKFKQSMKSSVPLLDKITGYIVKRKGKQIRPMFVFLSAQCVAPINESTYRAASLIELLHTATLVHDDVVDDSNERRGFFSVNALWKNKIAVLIGDFLLSSGLLLSLDNNDFHLLKIVSNAVREMSEGELLQIEKARKLDISEEIYFEIITKKTATLIAACCSAGVASVSEDKALIKTFLDFGTFTGIAFQIKDDLFDFGDDTSIGKPTGIDIKEKKMTLPLIYAIKTGSSEQAAIIRRAIEKGGEDGFQPVLEVIQQTGALDYARQRAQDESDIASATIASLPNSEYKECLLQLTVFAVTRNY